MSEDLSKALEIIKFYEGCRLVAYRDPAGILTIGWGHTGHVTPGEQITHKQAEDLLIEDMAWVESQIKKMVTVPLTNNELCSLISFTFNIGTKAFYHSTLLFELNRGIDKPTVAEQFLRWVHAGGRVMEGLVTRRKAEARLFLT